MLFPDLDLPQRLEVSLVEMGHPPPPGEATLEIAVTTFIPQVSQQTTLTHSVSSETCPPSLFYFQIRNRVIVK